MKSKLILLAVGVWLISQITGGIAPVSATERQQDPQQLLEKKGSEPRPAPRDLTDLSEREKWKMARDAYDRAVREERRKDIETAAYYYEAALELLGNLNLASIDLQTHRVLEFQRKVLRSYDRFVASIESLPASAGPMAVLEARIEDAEEIEDEVAESTGDREIEPLPVNPIKPVLPSVPTHMNSHVAGQINFFTNKGHKVMLRWMERAAYVFPRLRPILQEEGIPEEVMYLAMIESGLNPRAYSYAHAAGVWQFIPSTGRIFGLNVDQTYDERLHIESATRAACRYLRKLHNQFGDWYLAFAAYNCGEGRVEREIARSHTRDYWKLTHLPRQTRNYVPAYLAARAICEDPERYGFPKRPADVPYSCETVWVDGSYRLEEVAYCTGQDPDIVKDINPEFLRGVTPSRGRSMVRLPAKARDEWELQLASRPKVVLPEVAVHRVKKGETLNTISRKYGVSVAAIKALPENRKLTSKLKTGQQVTVPLSSGSSYQTAANTSPTTPQKPAAAAQPKAQTYDHTIRYTVQRGESLGQIAQRIGVSVDEICRQNNIKNRNKVHVGQRLKVTVPGGTLTSAEKSGVRKTYTVQRGDTLTSIARKHGKEPDVLRDLNNLSSSTIYPGQELIISAQ